MVPACPLPVTDSGVPRQGQFGPNRGKERLTWASGKEKPVSSCCELSMLVASITTSSNPGTVRMRPMQWMAEKRARKNEALEAQTEPLNASYYVR